MALPPTAVNSDSSLTLLRVGSSSLSSPVGRRSRKSKLESPGLLLPLSSSPGNNNNNGGDGSRRRLTGSNSKHSFKKDKDEEDVKKINVTLEVCNSVNHLARRMSPVVCSSFLARVDPILDFWLVDEELQGRFHVWSTPPPSTASHSRLWHQQAIIFKVKTTSPYNFFASPICGLMRPNVVATIMVKCDSRSSQSRVKMDEFLVEVVGVPGAIAAMTNDLYTSSVPSNFPELMAVWERIDQEANKGSYSLMREFHGVSCRFHRTSEELERTKFAPRMTEVVLAEQAQGKVGTFEEGGVGDNNNFETFDNDHAREEPRQPQLQLYDNCSFNQPSQMECYLAREIDLQVQEREQNLQLDNFQEENWHCCSNVRGLQISNVILALLLIGALVYICIMQFHEEKKNNYNNTTSSYDERISTKKIKELFG